MPDDTDPTQNPNRDPQPGKRPGDGIGPAQ